MFIKLFKKIDPAYITIIALFIIWKVTMLFVLVGAFLAIPLFSLNYLGGGLKNYLNGYYIFPWGNFDGEHFTSIAIFGYRELQQAFFPLYPTLISLPMYIFGWTHEVASKSGFVISTIAFPLALVFFYKLLKLDYSKNFSLGVISILLLYPASFYFNAVYTEALFLLLIVASFYCFRTKHYFWAGVFGFLASLTRVFGVLLFLSFLIEVFLQKIPFRKVYWIILIPIGLLSYMIYLYFSVGDPLAFYNLQLVVGEQHQRGVVLFPQVVYRYAKMIAGLDSISPLLTTILFELAAGIIFMLLPIIGLFYRVRLSYLFFAFFGYVLPTIQGSFSSLPRYVLVLFPSFLIIGLLIKNLPLYMKVILGIISFMLLVIEAALYLRGYWVA